MNQALEYCENNYTIFINAGDTLKDSNVLTSMNEYISKSKYPDFAFGDVITSDEDLDVNNVLTSGRVISYKNHLSRFYLYRKMICHQTWFLKTQIYKYKKYREDYKILADYLFLLELIFQNKVRYMHVQLIIANYDRHGISSKQNDLWKHEYNLVHDAIYTRAELAVYKVICRILDFANKSVIKRFIYSHLPFDWRRKYNGL
jgi:putative colanic acid biosynthesis glycosyltransferase